MEKVNYQYKEYLQPVSTPMIILNTSRQIESLNDQAAQLLQLKEKDELKLDKQSQIFWERLVKQLSQDEYYHCVLNIKLKEKIEQFNFVCHYDRKNELIYARIKKQTKFNININKKFVQAYSMFKDFPNGLLISEIDGNVIDLNEIASQMLGYEKYQLLNKPYGKFLDDFIDQNMKYHYLWELSCYGQGFIEISRNIDGNVKWYKIESRINQANKLIYSTITDVTENYLLKQKYEHQNSLVALGEMVATIAHEIRNPMTSINGFLELLKQNANETNIKYLDVMKSELARMDDILAEILSLSKPVERQNETISVEKVVKEVEEIMYPLATLHNIKIQVKVNTQTFITGNSNRVKQMLINLVKNAIEEMVVGGTIHIKVRKLKGKIQLQVVDQGHGIEKEKIPELFTSFYTTKPGGTGLGLYLVKQVVEEHNGEIKVQSKVNEGTTFTIVFPLMEQAQYINSNLSIDA